MKVRCLDGKIHDWKPRGERVRGTQTRPRSEIHLAARTLLTGLFPTLKISEEVRVPLRTGKHVYVDFYINTIKTVVEVHGEQHYKFSSFFHKTAQDFVNQKRRDSELQEWCISNNITYVELPFNESLDEWQIRISPSHN